MICICINIIKYLVKIYVNILESNLLYLLILNKNCKVYIGVNIRID